MAEGPLLAWNAAPGPVQQTRSVEGAGSVPFEADKNQMKGQLQLLRKKIRVRQPAATLAPTPGQQGLATSTSRSSSAPAGFGVVVGSPPSPAAFSDRGPDSGPAVPGRSRQGSSPQPAGEERLQPRRVASTDAAARRAAHAGGASLSPMAKAEPAAPRRSGADSRWDTEPAAAEPAAPRFLTRGQGKSSLTAGAAARAQSVEVREPASSSAATRESSARPPRPGKRGDPGEQRTARPPSAGRRSAAAQPYPSGEAEAEAEAERAPSPTLQPTSKGKGRGRGRGSGAPARPSKDSLLPTEVNCGGSAVSRDILDRITSFLPVQTLPSFRRTSVCFHTVVAKRVAAEGDSLRNMLDTHLECRRLNSKRVWVCVRARPSDKLGGLNIDKNRVTVPGQNGTAGITFFSDQAFGGPATQDEVSHYICDRLLYHALNGEHICLMAYGQTGSGKTHTMFGSLEAGDNKALAFYAVAKLGEMLRNGSTQAKSIDFSFMECYNNDLYDLLDGAKPLSKQRSSDQHVVPQGLTRRSCNADNCEAQVSTWLREGAASRTVGKTVFNPRSSRSHGIVLLTLVWAGRKQNSRLLETKSTAAASPAETRIYIVDLAGSERAGLYAVDEHQLKEGEHINLSLSALGRVVGALAGGKCKHVPYRDSALTWLLKDAITGTSARVCLVAAVHPAHPVETTSTLRYAKQYSALQTSTGSVVPDLTSEVRTLQRKLDQLKHTFKKAMEGDEGDGWTKESLTGNVTPTRNAKELIEAHAYLQWTKHHQSKAAVRGQRRDRSTIGRIRTTLDVPEPRLPSDAPDGRLLDEAQRNAEDSVDPDGMQPYRVVEVVFEGRHGRPPTILWYPEPALEEVLPPKALMDALASIEKVEEDIAKKKTDLKAAQDFCKNEQKEWMNTKS